MFTTITSGGGPSWRLTAGKIPENRLAEEAQVDVGQLLASSLTREQELEWLALRLVAGLGTRSATKLLERFRTPQAILRASRSELEARGVAGAVAQSIASGCAYEDAVVQQEKMAQAGAAVVTMTDPRYPQRLREIFDPPILLFTRGRIELLESLTLAVVGTRRPTPYGLAVTERLAGDLARAGLTIVSGMARGIDTAAHRGALGAVGNTMAVLGCGVDIAYPPENHALFDQIAGRGAVISEFPLSSAPLRENFPRRNRIISGLSRGVLVVEADVASGALITARLACDSHNRPVFAIPGRIDQAMSAGPHALIRDGAVLVMGLEDILDNLGPLPHEITVAAAAVAAELPAAAQPPEIAAGVALDARQQRIVDEIGAEPTPLDTIIARTDLPAEVVMQDLTMLTLRGVLKRVEGQVYVCNAKRKLASSE